MLNKAILVCLLFVFTQYVSAYSVSGNKLLGPTGAQVRLRGTNRCSFEWSVTGESASLSDYQKMASWGFNVVRLPVNQDFWLSGSGTYNSNYQATIAQQVAWIKQAGMGVIIDLHWSDQGNLHISGGAGQQVMADLNSITFWSQCAAAYKNDPYVMFELYNEPHDVSWSIWQSGGTSNGFTVAGMQQLYNAVRATGANNVIIIGGLNWAYDLSGVANYAISGSNIAYATHAYDYPGKQSGDWDSGFGYLAATYPVIMTEYGQYCNTDTYVADLLVYAESKGIHWVAWAWYPGGCSFPAIINDWTGAPTSVGNTVKSHLSGGSSSAPASSPTSAPASSPTSAPATSAPATSKPASGATSAPTSASSSSVVYADSLQNGWIDWSWATRSLTNTNPVYSGSNSISFTLASYGGIYFHTSNPVYVGTYQSIQFYTNGPSANVQVKLYDNSSPIGNAVNLPSSSSSGSWTLQNVALSSFGLSSSTQFYGIAITYNNGGNGGTLYVDSISLAASSSAAPVVTSAPTTPATTPAPTAKPTSAPTPAPTPAPTSAPTAKATSAPTPAPTSAPTAKATSAPTPAPTVAPATKAPAPPAPAATAQAVPSTSDGCSAAHVKVSQSLATSFQSGGNTVYQYNVIIENTCTLKTLSGLTLSASGWNPANFWNLQVSGSNTIALPSYATVAPSGSYTSAGYQNVGGQATFTVASATFQ